MALGPSGAVPSSPAAPAQPAPAPSPSSESESLLASASGAVLSSSSPSTAAVPEEEAAVAAVRAATTGKMPKLIPCPPRGANSEAGAERIHCNDNKNDDIDQVKLVFTTIQHYLASIDKHLKTIVNFHVLIDNRLTTMMGISQFASPLASRLGPSMAAVVTSTPANEEAVKRMKILEELKGGCVPENVVLPENPESEAASAQGLHQDNSYTVQISGIPAYALSK